MEDFKVSIEQYRGDSYDIGYQQCQQIDRSLLVMYSNIINKEGINLEELKEIYLSYAPHLFRELSGIADSMDIPLRTAALFSGFGAPEIQGMGCSSVVNHKMLVRNYDFSPEAYDARFVFVQPSEGYASVGHSLHVMGRTEGVNEKGLAAALHFVNSKDTQNGLTAASVIRIILDTCKNTEEAVNVIKDLPHSWSYNFSIGDAEGNAAVIEESPFDIKIRKSEEILLCTNHFQRGDMSIHNRENLEGTRERLNYLGQNNLAKMDVQGIFNMFKADKPLYSEEYHEFFGTLHTFAYSFNDNKVLTAVPNGDVLEIDFNEWVKGKDLNQKEIIGRLNNY